VPLREGASPSALPSTAPRDRAESSPPSEIGQSQSPDGRSRRQRVVDRVGGWLEGEAQEFRDGTRREVENFRAGFDRLGRGLSSLGGKLRRSD